MHAGRRRCVSRVQELDDVPWNEHWVRTHLPNRAIPKIHLIISVRSPNGTTTFQPMSPADITFAQELIAYWVSFVRVFKLKRSPAWVPFTTDDRERIVLQEDPDGSTTVSGNFGEQKSEGEGSRCDFVAGLNAHQGNSDVFVKGIQMWLTG